MPIAKPIRIPSRFVTLATVVVVVGVLRLTAEVTIPLAIALLLAFLLSPMVVRLTRWGWPKPLAIVATATLAFTIVAIAGWNIGNQAVALLEDIPKYEENLQAKITALKRPGATSSLARAITTVERMQADLFAPSTESRRGARDGKGTPVPVEVKQADRTSLDLASELLRSLVRPLGTAGIVIVFVIAILFQREDLRNRFIRVISGGQLNIATQAVDDAAQRVSRYLVAQLMVNMSFGLCIGVGLAFIGIPHAALWGLLATLLRFIPFLGPLIAASFPLVLAVAVDPGWTMLLWTGGLFIVAEIITNNLIEVWVYGTSTGVSTLALLTAAVFWSWLWGIAGLFLSTPLTVCLLVIGQYVPALKFLGVLLGSAPPMDPSEQFYQRMLSMNQEEMFNAADTYVSERSLAGFYDDVFVPALLMSEVDRHNGVLAEVRQKFIFEASMELIEELGERYPTAKKPDSDAAPVPVSSRVILGLPARDEADELIARMLAHLLRETGLTVDVIAVTAAPETYLEKLKGIHATVIVSALPPSTLSAAGRATRRVKQANPLTKVLVGVWRADNGMEDLKRRLDPAGVDAIATRLGDAVVQVQHFLDNSEVANTPTPETETTHSLERAEIKLASIKPEDATDAVTRELARAFEVPLSLVCVLETDSEFWKSLSQRAPAAPLLEASVYADVLKADALHVIEDVAKDDRYSGNSTLIQRGVRFFASAPLRTRSGHLVGNLCVLDTHPRKFGETDRELLQSLAAQLMEVIDGEPAPLAPGSARG